MRSRKRQSSGGGKDNGTGQALGVEAGLWWVREELEKWCGKNISATVSRKKVAKQKTTYKVFPCKSFNLLERETRFELATFSLGS